MEKLEHKLLFTASSLAGRYIPFLQY